MAKFTFKANSEFETLTHEEMQDALTINQRNWFREMARGVKHMQVPPTIGTPATGTLTLPTVGGEPIGPNPGFVWAVQRLSAAGLRSTDVLSVYRNNVDPQNFVGNLTATSPMLLFGDKGFLLKDGDTLAFNGTSLSATQVIVTGELVECATIDIWKILNGG